MAEDDPKNEGEGSRTAARAYNEKTKQFVENEDVEARKGTSCARRKSRAVLTHTARIHRSIATNSGHVAPIRRRQSVGVCLCPSYGGVCRRWRRG